jgi:ABC-type transport system involved in cytochrome bd biosynthesis fused ATPase/permease subunit
MNSLKLAYSVLRSCGLPDGRMKALLATYYVLTPFGALLDGLSWLQLVRLVAADSAPADGMLTSYLDAFGPATPALVGSLFLAKAALSMALTLIETALSIVIRRGVQAACLQRVVHGRWDVLRGQRIGRWVGALTEELPLLTRYIMAAFNALYLVISATLLAGMAATVAPSLALKLAALAVPAGIGLKTVYGVQTRLAKSQATARQGMAADLTESLSGIFQAKASGEVGSLVRRALRGQVEVFRRESQLGWTLGLLAVINPLGMGLALLALAAWGTDTTAASLGGVGVLSFRAATAVNALVAVLGTLTRMAGSIKPIDDLATIPAEPAREPLGERLVSARLEGVSYSQGDRRVLDEASLVIEPGRLLLVTGPSGAGKTTLINLLAGLFAPDAGKVIYRGESGVEHDAANRRARVAYVAQDVHIFSGTVRTNLDPDGTLGDDALWRSLARAGAADFVRARGGLEAVLAEAGRSLSGGERRRLAVARALAHEADLLALDEVTNGLDEAGKTALVTSIAELAREMPVVAVTHDAAIFAPASPRVFSLARGGRAEP